MAANLNHMVRQQLTLQLNVVQQQLRFAASCLPLTMELAALHRKRIIWILDPSTAEFPFEDRVLIWLAPYWRVDIEEFHRRNGESMVLGYKQYKLDRFDLHYCHKLRKLIAPRE